MKSFKGLALLLALITIIGITPLSALAEKPDTPRVPVSEYKAKDSAVTPTKEVKKELLDFDFSDDLVAAVYKARSGHFTVSPIPTPTDATSLIKQLNNQVKPVSFTADQQNEATKNIEGSFLIVFRDGNRRIYTLLKGGFLQVGNKYFSIPAEVYTALLSVYNKDYNRASFAQWLIYMQPNRVTAVTLESGGVTTVVNKENLSQIILLIRGTRVTKGSSYSPKLFDFTPTEGKSKITINFGEDHYYEIKLDGKGNMYVESDELHIACEYTIVSSDIAALMDAINKPPTVAKEAKVA